MDKATHNTHEIASAILDYERGILTDADASLAATAHVFLKLQSYLTKRLGAGGYRSVVNRAVSVSKAQVPLLSPIHVEDNGALDGFDDCLIAPGSAKESEGYVVLISNFLALMDTFLGPDMSLRLLGSIWPDVAVNCDAKQRSVDIV